MRVCYICTRRNVSETFKVYVEHSPAFYSEVLTYFFIHDDLVLAYRTVSDLVSMRDSCVMFQ